MTDGDKAALIVDAEYALMTARQANLDDAADLLDRLIIAVKSQPDLERVKREAGAAALRDFVEALYEPGLIENHGGQEFIATSVIESTARALTARIERGE